jgi:hypothetical protein
MARAAVMPDRERLKVTAVLANFALGGLGLLLLALAWRMDAQWAERHFLPVWTWTWAVQLRILLALRLLAALAGLLVLFTLRRWFVRACARGRAAAALGSAARVGLAVLAALAATELVLRTQTWRAAQEQANLVDPLRIHDREFGWSFAANRAATVMLDGRVVHYATGPFGYRAARAGLAPDFARPTVVFAGESVVFGYGLEWPDTIAAQVQALTGIQTVNIAINAHATDQLTMRLRRELPRFAHPVAVVIPFMPRLLDRNLDGDKPHLDAVLRWHAAGPPPIRLIELTRRMLRYRDPADVARGEATTSAVLKGAIAAAEARGARPIVLVPQYLPEEPVERRIREVVLDRAGIPYLLVPIPPRWRSPTHYHPTREGAAALAAAVSKAVTGQ